MSTDEERMRAIDLMNAQIMAARTEPDDALAQFKREMDPRVPDPYRSAKANVDAFFDVAPDVFRDHMNARWGHRTLVLSGTELQAYRAVQAAAHSAHAAQQTMATTGATLREAIQGLCAAIAPGEKP